MRPLQTAFREHSLKLWGLTLVMIALLGLNVAAQQREAPARWEYKIVQFKITQGDNTARLEVDFAEALNRHSAAGWEYSGRCAHVDGDGIWIDYVVFRRPR
jgi:hypothetical protein